MLGDPGKVCLWEPSCDDGAFHLPASYSYDFGDVFDPTEACGGLDGDLTADSPFTALFGCITVTGHTPNIT